LKELVCKSMMIVEEEGPVLSTTTGNEKKLI
jgi:hypothetical protein